MKRFIGFKIYFFFVIASIAFLFLFCEKKNGGQNNSRAQNYDRVISLSPSTTEILFTLGLGEQVVGVTDFCTYPKEAKAKTKIGGYLDPNYEAIVGLKPDIVLLLPEQDKVKEFLAQFNIESMTVNNKMVADVIKAINQIGEKFAREDKSDSLVSAIEKRIQWIQKQTKNRRKPSVLVSVGRTLGTGELSEVYAAAQNTYYNELINLAGGKNVLKNMTVDFPVLSAEGIIHLNPDIIFDLAYDYESQGLTENELIADWEAVPQIDAVREGRVFVLNQSFAVIPGPRFILLLEKMAQLIHPEIDWD